MGKKRGRGKDTHHHNPSLTTAVRQRVLALSKETTLKKRVVMTTRLNYRPPHGTTVHFCDPNSCCLFDIHSETTPS
jgi:hypothetical protein